MALLDTIANLKVIVIGEAMLDGYISGKSDRLCPEAPVPVVTVNNRLYVPGGAANTALNVQSLGGNVKFLSVIGDDWEGSQLRQALLDRGVSTEYILSQPDRQTLTKQRVMAAGQILVRFDSGTTDPIGDRTEQLLIDKLKLLFSECDAVIVSDYAYGILTKNVINELAQLQHSNPRVLVVDSKNLTAYSHLGATAVKPNYEQVVQLIPNPSLPNPSLPPLHKGGLSNPLMPPLHKGGLGGFRANQIAPYGEKLLDITGAKIAAVTLDAEGAIIFERSRSPHRTYAQPTIQSRTTGAGDTFTSALTLALAAGATTALAADFAAAAAAVVVAKDGTTACSTEELRQFLSPSQKYIPNCNELVSRITAYRNAQQKIVFTNGCFDILHPGHVWYLQQAKALGDILIIGVNSDDSIRRIKGSTRPINPLEDRLQVLEGLGCVNHLVAFDEDTPCNLISLICPDIYVKGGDYTRETLPEAPLVEQFGGVVEILPFVENRSTTRIIERINKLNLL
nr:D-glycero-beta-D-manno-heptose 1-phosphate adenylyltransferase [Iningainema tapete]